MKRKSGPPKPRSASLEIRDVEFNAPVPWHRNSSLMRPLISVLDAQVSGTSISLKEIRERRSTVAQSWSEVGSLMRSKGSGYYQMSVTGGRTESSFAINLTDVSFSLEVQTPLDDEDVRDARLLLRRLLEALHGAYCESARVGPSLSITLQNIPYKRPRPFRDNPNWPAGAITLAACRGFFASAADTTARFEALQTRDLPDGLIRRTVGDLLLIETSASGSPELSAQRTMLEKWIGETLALSLDEDFNDLGDRRLLVANREPVGRLGFYDSFTNVLYKSAPELRGDQLDTDTLALLEEVLSTDQLPDGRPISLKRVVFVRRSAAIRWASWVGERGGTAAYLGEDGELWELALEQGTE